MADKTYKLNISKSDGSFNDSVQFTIPEREGTYKVEFELSNGNKVNAGNINVSTVEKTYKAEFQLSDGSKIEGGTFTTPVIPPKWHVVWEDQQILSTNFFKVQGSKVKVATGTMYIQGATIDFSKPTRLTGYANYGNGVPDRQDFSEVEIGNELKEVVAYQFTFNGKTFLNKVSIKKGDNLEYSTSLEQVPQTAGFMGFAIKFVLTKIEQLY